ncbi:hypothetical protein [Streptomyces lunaelactis]|uniref:hypothetical protein n=1 Tax=Streptomyces lunaelactis TaxID=1535768 RepID=UPI00131F2205|nr:hypothetical protein [Streptomyces lunaelactis]NUK84416.1 hypothetical protein [Streptomyces lunaelactis]NUL04226.1 hypothetical protein [Streptomyces lunaelactis]
MSRAHGAFTVKLNQRQLHAQLKALPWKEARAGLHDRNCGHSRLEALVVHVLTVTDPGGRAQRVTTDVCSI